MASTKPSQSTSRKASLVDGVDGVDDDDDDEEEDEEEEDDDDDEGNEEDNAGVKQYAAESSTDERTTTPVKSSERYFIVKSLTLQDLEQSVRNGIWATQSHNEAVLNKAYNVSGVPTMQLNSG
jgi:hypothetical protein